MGHLPQFNNSSRLRMIGQVQGEVQDILVIGGGITGAGVFRDICTRHSPLKVCLIEANDFAYGTSSRSTKLIHGGIRYLETYDFSLVFESVSERYLLSKLAPHLVKPQAFRVPWTKTFRVPAWQLSLGMWLYDLLALFRNYRSHRQIGSSQEPLLAEGQADKLFEYYDYRTDDARLTLENIISGYEAGGSSLSYLQLQGCRKDDQGIFTLECLDKISNKVVLIKAKCILNATGPWSGDIAEILGAAQRVALRPTKGTHIAIPFAKLPVNEAILINSKVDKRVMFVIPWDNQLTVIGTTDTDIKNDPTDDQVTAEDAKYLIDSIEGIFKNCSVGLEDIISSWVGLRPLIAPSQEGAATSQVSREHQLWESPGGVYHIVGGKLTTYRLMAEQISERILRDLKSTQSVAIGPSTTRFVPLPGAQGPKYDSVLGCRQALVDRIDTSQETRQPISDRTTITRAQIYFHTVSEAALTVSDVMVRRTDLYYRFADHGVHEAETVAEIMAKALGWSPSTRQEMVQDYLSWASRINGFRSRI